MSNAKDTAHCLLATTSATINALLTPHQGLCPWTLLGAPPRDPRFGLALRALVMLPPLCQILNTPLDMIFN